MENASITPVKAIMPFLDKNVGFVKINKTFIHHNNSYECAAWWQDSEIQKGIYPLTLRAHYYAPRHIELKASLKSIVTDDFFPAFFGGTSIGSRPYVSNNIGSVRDITFTFDVIKSILNTGNISGDDMDFYINMEIIQPIIDDARASLLTLKESLDREMVNYNLNGDGHFNQNLGMISYYSKNIHQFATAIDRLSRKLIDHNNMTEYSKNLFETNTQWVKEAA